MKHLGMLALALVFGGVAAAINWFWMAKEKDYPDYAYLQTEVAHGELIGPEHLRQVPVKGDPAVLGKTLVPWAQRELWYGRAASRDYQVGDPLLQRDMAAEASPGGWDTLGPFKLIGVGSEPSSTFRGQPGDIIPTSGNVLTLAAEEDQDEEKGLLYRYLAAMRGEFYFNESGEERDLLKIIAVEPRVSNASPSPSTEPGVPGGAETGAADVLRLAGKRLVFVSMENIPNAPSFLRIGEDIYFVVPPGKGRFLRDTTDPRVSSLPNP
ncbi:MAG: hypothetical protein RIC55_22965 [Pirellulaceae bacterium]